MNKLLEKFLDFKKLNNYSFKYTIEDGSTIVFKISQYNFPHLIGLHKLIDIPIITQFINQNNKTVSSQYIVFLIKKESILTDESIRSSAYFSEIEKRYNFISKESILSLSFSEVIINFDRTKAYSNIQSAYLLTENRENGILHLGLRLNGDVYVPETFFFRNDDRYIKGQEIQKIKSLEVYDENNKLKIRCHYNIQNAKNT